MLKRIGALGRLRPGEMNKTEKRYADLLQIKKCNKEILDFWFESIKLQVGSNTCWYCPDFLVQKADKELILVEVKGSKFVFQDDAKVKVKAVALRYPFKMFVVYPPKRGSQDWQYEEYGKNDQA